MSVAVDPEIAEAHRRLIADGQVQTAFADPPVETDPPEWLVALRQWLGELLQSIGEGLGWLLSFLPDVPWIRVVVVTALIGIAVFAITVLVRRLRERRARPPKPEMPETDDWQPGAAPAKRWLDEAEAFAQEGKFAEAVHHLLFRSIADIEARRPDIVRPASTSRDIAAAPNLPERARGFFAAIATTVERSLFGGRSLGESDWAEARETYENFALRSAWQAER